MKRRLLCACQVAAVSEAGRAYVWACAAEEDGRVSGTLTATVDVAGAAPSQTCACSPWQADKQFSMPTPGQTQCLSPGLGLRGRAELVVGRVVTLSYCILDPLGFIVMPVACRQYTFCGHLLLIPAVTSAPKGDYAY